MAVGVALVGSSGSIGTQALEVIESEPERFELVSLAVNRSADLVIEQARRHRPRLVGVVDEQAGAVVETALAGSGIEVVVGGQALDAAASLGEVVLNAVVGFSGLAVTLAAVSSGRRLALANKESLIAGGPVVAALAAPGSEIVPVDSEHCAIHQCLRSGSHDEVARLILTASGGPFRGRSAQELAGVTRDQALAHPTWSMGPKITVDSSTLMNKGLEVIEAKELFGVDIDRIEVQVHPQSVVHSMVEFVDGSVLAQLSQPDMRLPIGYALGHPNRIETPYGRIEWSQLGRLDFEPPDRATFRCLDLAYEAGRQGETAPAWLNGANEEAVAGFLEGRLRWFDIAAVIDTALQSWDGARAEGVESVVAADAAGREAVVAAMARL